MYYNLFAMEENMAKNPNQDKNLRGSMAKCQI